MTAATRSSRASPPRASSPPGPAAGPRRARARPPIRPEPRRLRAGLPLRSSQRPRRAARARSAAWPPPAEARAGACRGRTAPRRPLRPAQELVAVERLAAAATLDDVHADGFRPLVRGEALVAVLALPPSANGVSRLAGVHDAMLGRSTVGALHVQSILLPLVVLLRSNHKILWKLRVEAVYGRPASPPH